MPSQQRGAYAIMWFVFVVSVIVFICVLGISACSGCDVRRRSDKAACRAGNVDKCLAVGQYYEGKADGLLGFAMSNGNTAAEYYWRACKLKSDDACTHMMKMRDHTDNARGGDLKATDIVDALIGTCAEHAGERPADVPSCAALWDYMDGVDWAQNRSAQHFTTLCDGGSAIACYWLARMHGANLGGLQNVRDQVIPIYDKSCAGGVQAACTGAQNYRNAQKAAGSDAGSAAVTSDAGASP